MKTSGSIKKSTHHPSLFGKYPLQLLASALVFHTVSGAVAAAQIASLSPTPVFAPFSRIVLVGASATAGFTLFEPLGGPDTSKLLLSRYLDAAILPPHGPMLDLAGAMFFLQPESQGQQQVAQALAAHPSLVIGIDFLFWFCYGAASSAEERRRRFEKGLAMLDSIPCPMVIGDIPDAEAATHGILSPDQIPSSKALAAANRRLKQWASARPRVSVVSMSEFMRTSMANHALTVHGHTLPEGKTRTLLQEDKLHPTPTGAAVLAVVILDTFLSHWPDIPKTDVQWDFKEVLRRGFNSTQKASAGETKPAIENLEPPGGE